MKKNLTQLISGMACQPLWLTSFWNLSRHHRQSASPSFCDRSVPNTVPISSVEQAGSSRMMLGCGLPQPHKDRLSFGVDQHLTQLTTRMACSVHLADIAFLEPLWVPISNFNRLSSATDRSRLRPCPSQAQQRQVRLVVMMQGCIHPEEGSLSFGVDQTFPRLNASGLLSSYG